MKIFKVFVVLFITLIFIYIGILIGVYNEGVAIEGWSDRFNEIEDSIDIVKWYESNGIWIGGIIGLLIGILAGIIYVKIANWEKNEESSKPVNNYQGDSPSGTEGWGWSDDNDN